MILTPTLTITPIPTQVEVVDVSYDVFKLLLGYLYTGDADVPAELAAPLVLLAERYMVYPLQLECVRTLIANLTSPRALWETLDIASSLHLPPPADAPEGAAPPADELLGAAVAYFCSSHREVAALVGAPEFAALSSSWYIRSTRVTAAPSSPTLTIDFVSCTNMAAILGSSSNIFCIERNVPLFAPPDDDIGRRSAERWP